MHLGGASIQVRQVNDCRFRVNGSVQVDARDTLGPGRTASAFPKGRLTIAMRDLRKRLRHDLTRLLRIARPPTVVAGGWSAYAAFAHE